MKEVDGVEVGARNGRKLPQVNTPATTTQASCSQPYLLSLLADEEPEAQTGYVICPRPHSL